MHPDHSPTEAPLHTAAIAGSADQLHVVIGTEDGLPLPAEAVAAGLTVQITPPGDLNFWNWKESRLIQASQHARRDVAAVFPQQVAASQTPS